MNVPALLLSGWLVMALVMTIVWAIQRATRNAGIVDAVWSFGTGLLAAAFALLADGWAPRRALVAVLAATWGVRLGVHLVRRIRSDAAEDVRYREMRREHGDRVQLFFFGFFQLQALWTMLFAIPMLFAARNPSPGFAWTDALGVVLWVTSIAGESIADRQLQRFRSDPANRGKVCRAGLWRVSRHPNYFFEWVHWWAYVALGLAGPTGWVTLFGPVVMLLFLLKVTGIPLLEQRMVESRGDAYRAYQRTTSPFVPWPPRSLS